MRPRNKAKTALFLGAVLPIAGAFIPGLAEVLHEVGGPESLVAVGSILGAGISHLFHREK